MATKYSKYSTEELMELVDLFNVSDKGQAAIRKILKREPTLPAAWLFRYYGTSSRVERLEKRFAEKIGCRYCQGTPGGRIILRRKLPDVGNGRGHRPGAVAQTGLDQ